MPANHNTPHTKEAKDKIRLAKLGKPVKWGNLSHTEIVNRLLTTEATICSIASEYGCSGSTIALIFRKYTTKEQRLKIKAKKQGNKLRGRANLQLKEWRKTHDIWTGRKHTEEAKRKQSLAHKGKKQSMKQRITQSARLQGITTKEWNGFATTEAERQKASVEFNKWRKAVFERDSFTCRLCGKFGNTLHPHHIKPFAKYPKLRFEISNGITLCAEPCHKQTIGKEEMFEEQFINLILG